MRGRGYSIIELTIVIIIVGILAVAMALQMRSREMHKLRAAAEKMATDIRYAQQFARTTGRWAKVDFVQACNTCYNIWWVTPGNSTENNIMDPLYPNKNIIVDFNVATSPYQGVTIVFPGGNSPSCQTNGTGLNDNIYFDTNGVPWCCDSSTSGCGTMDPMTVTLSYGGRQGTVAVEPQTGIVTVSIAP